MTTDDTRTADWRRYEPLQLHPILRHSLTAFDEHGYHGTTVRDIAKRLGQTVPAIYYHFENKQALLITLLMRSMEDVLHRCELAAAEAGDDPVARLELLIDCVTRYVAHRREFIVLDSEIRSLEEDNRAAYVARRDALQALVRGAVVQGVEEGVFRTAHPSDAARALLTMCLGIGGWYRPDGPLTPEELGPRYARFALDMVGHVAPGS
ncbi:TetR/AcrR family transcriptional regulator [Nitriliruptoraceae bacterium ZYF776]|nr:TetR/AcrR family transcriptional regulator [Profundirhabdus halotolerans]